MTENRVRLLMSTKLRDENGAPIRGLHRLSEPRPIRFPPGLLEKGIEGSAVIAFTVLADGTVEDVRVIAATHAEYAAAARADLANWKFWPLAGTNIAVPVQARCHLTFKTD
jgi:TonB family protein